MKRLLVATLAILIAAPAFAQCYPPPGLAVQQWYAMCGSTMEQGYSQGMGQGMSYDDFVMMVYQRYAAGSPGQAMQPMQPMQQHQLAPGLQQCPPGAAQCMNGWARSCQRVGNGTMWITSAPRC